MKVLSTVILLALLSITPARAFFFLEGSVGAGLGNAETTQLGSPSYVHDAFALGYSIDGRAGAKLMFFDLGATLSYGSNAAKFTREDPSSSVFTEARYNVTFSHFLYGAHLGFNIPILPIKVFAEYYPNVTSKVTFSESKAENIFTKDTDFNGNGFGLGLQFTIFPFLRIHGIYRALTLDELESSTRTTALPSASQSDLTFNMFYAGVTIAI